MQTTLPHVSTPPQPDAEAEYARTVAMLAAATGRSAFEMLYHLNSRIPTGKDAERTVKQLPPPPAPYLIVNSHGGARWASGLEAKQIRAGAIKPISERGRPRRREPRRGLSVRRSGRRTRAPASRSDDSEPDPPGLVGRLVCAIAGWLR